MRDDVDGHVSTVSVVSTMAASRLLALAALLAGAACASATAVGIAAQTCPASGCGEPAFNEFFPFIKRVGYNPAATDPYTFRYYNKHEARFTTRRKREQLDRAPTGQLA